MNQPDFKRRRMLQRSAQGLGLSSMLAGCGSLSAVMDPPVRDPEVSSSETKEIKQASGGPQASGPQASGPSNKPRSQPEAALRDRPASAIEAPAEADETSNIERLLLAQMPEVRREFRAAWVASVANIDWPSKPGLSSAALRTEIDRITSISKRTGLNALIVQVRPSADAMYASDFEPSSEFLVGKQGAALADGFDPLTYWIKACKAQGLEFHAWFNPFRARYGSAKSSFHAKHLAKRHPELVVKYGNQWWMNPAEPKALQWTLSIIEDVVKRYDIDGVHLDDYFYPYPVPMPGGKSSELPFPDEKQFKTYESKGGKLSKADWRRSLVNNMVEHVYERVHQQKPWVRVGISPFGLGKPALRPSGIQGFSQYDQLYADVEHWCDKAWFDYLSPQLYWKIDQKAQAFDVLLNYWAQRIHHKRHLWPGLFTSAIGQAPRLWTAKEILSQIERQRMNPSAGGHIHFSMNALLRDREGIASSLSKDSYVEMSMVPASPWLSRGKPEAPQQLQADAAGMLRWESPLGSKPWSMHPARWVLHQRSDAKPGWQISQGDVELHPIALKPNHEYVLRLLNRVGESSDAIAFRWKP